MVVREVAGDSVGSAGNGDGCDDDGDDVEGNVMW